MTAAEGFSVLGVVTVAGTILVGLIWGITAWYQKGAKARRNTWVGFRLRPLFESDEAWRVGHQVAFKQFCLNALSIWIPSVVLLLIIKSAPVPIGIILIVLFVAQFIWLLVAARMAAHAAAGVGHPES
ncbi:SdpI family protein [Propionibacterium freudenreichii]|uniref:Immunity protein n=1 Tax=Propionibacterium freudenreichii TaxID=1744 RepID=A7XC65_9ACTN|nr:SdpI family protein [Propionibacterium freudenreichii]ABU97165.1 immunity protein [Propionibacterium freudenreichii]